jgi:hypothetical protein
VKGSLLPVLVVFAATIGGAALLNQTDTAAPASYYAATDETNQPAAVELLPDAWPCRLGSCLDRTAWTGVPSGLADALAEGESPGGTTRDWSACWVNGGFVVCADGRIEVTR